MNINIEVSCKSTQHKEDCLKSSGPGLQGRGPQGKTTLECHPARPWPCSKPFTLLWTVWSLLKYSKQIRSIDCWLKYIFHLPSLPNDRYYLHILLYVVSIFLLGMINSLPLLWIECTYHYALGLKHKSRNIFYFVSDSLITVKELRIKNDHKPKCYSSKLIFFLTLPSHLTKVTSVSHGHLLARENSSLQCTDPVSDSFNWLHEGGTPHSAMVLGAGGLRTRAQKSLCGHYCARSLLASYCEWL